MVRHLVEEGGNYFTYGIIIAIIVGIIIALIVIFSSKSSSGSSTTLKFTKDKDKPKT